LNSPKKIVIEACVSSINSAISAGRAGVDRVELCDNINEGGTTPSAGMIKAVSELLDCKLWVLVRPRGGDFIYNDYELDVIKRDIDVVKELNVDGIVIGILNANGEVDKLRMKEVIDYAYPLKVSFHRAFDMCKDPFAAMEDLINLNICRILTSGKQNTAMEGARLIKGLINKSNGRIEIMPGSGISADNIEKLKELTNATSFHLTGSYYVESDMKYQHTDVVLNNINPSIDYSWKETSETLLKEVIRKCCQ
jgi:copper homeostasis protein|tara:strand:- start:4729 stop:5484 length:756 start_codon:yes stop_codon:yes gene_type:complete